ncbi:hypothetical protein TNCV_4581161 [Trichonephila clavipes]|nr:hypothetical protein TNCV_4581161 [Trichonephila clavipes]
MARILQVHPGNDGLVRVATVKTQNSVLKRPVHKNFTNFLYIRTSSYIGWDSGLRTELTILLDPDRDPQDSLQQGYLGEVTYYHPSEGIRFQYWRHMREDINQGSHPNVLHPNQSFSMEDMKISLTIEWSY